MNSIPYPFGKLVIMKPRKIIIDIMVILSALLLFAIWYRRFADAGDTSNSAISLIKYNKVYLITTDLEYQYWQYVNQGASDMAKSSGIDYIWTAPLERSPVKQAEVINEAINDGANAMLIAADDPKRISSVVEDAKARGIKIIYVDSPANEEAIITLATDNYQAGVMAGKAMLEELGKKGITEGEVGIVSMPEKQNAELREAGFRSVISQDSGYKLLDTVFTNGEPIVAKEAAGQLIRDNHDLVGIFGTNEGTSQGVGMAIRDDNNRIIGIGFDKTDAMMELLKEGSLKAIIVQNPYTMGYLGMAEAIAALLGKDTGPAYIDTGVYVIRNDS